MLMLLFAILLTLSQILAAYLLFTWEVKKNTSHEHHSDLLALRLKALKSETELLQESLQTARVMRHDLRHHYRMLYVLLGDGDKEAALEHIASQEKLIMEKRESEGKN